LQKSEEKKWSTITSENIKVKKKAIYLSVNLITHCLLQSILMRWRWSNMITVKSNKNEKDENLYSTVRYNFTWLKEKLLTLSLLKMKNEMSLDVSIEIMSHRLHSMMYQQLKITRSWVHYAIMLFFEAVFAFASTLDKNMTYVSHHYA